MLYFAYGSNLSKRRIEARLGPCPVVGPAFAAGFDLRFHKVGGDGSGKCDALLTAAGQHAVHGVVYQVDAVQRERLDRCEGPGYSVRWVALQSDRGLLRSFLYVARSAQIDATLSPYHWYKAYVVAGAKEHGLPAAYVRRLESVGATLDPDPRRAEHNADALASGESR